MQRDQADYTIPLPALSLFNAFWPYADAGQHAALQWFEFQRGIWQSWADLQVAMSRQWMEQGIPGLPFTWVPCGTEQLA